MRIHAICPLSRPHRLETVLEEFRAQSHEDKRLVIVANGNAIYCPPPRDPAVVWTCSDNRVTIAKNTGLVYLRQCVGLRAPWVTWDDDDYHGPGYLEELNQAMLDEPADYYGKGVAFVRKGDAIRRYKFQPIGPASDHMLGATLASFAYCADFAPVPRGEDAVWMDTMQQRGARGWRTSGYHFALDRTPGDHLWDAPEDKWGPYTISSLEDVNQDYGEGYEQSAR